MGSHTLNDLVGHIVKIGVFFPAGVIYVEGKLVWVEEFEICLDEEVEYGREEVIYNKDYIIYVKKQNQQK